MQLPPDIFKAYDIRGIVGKTLTPPVVQAICQALGSLAREREPRAGCVEVLALGAPASLLEEESVLYPCT